ncbi:carbohydrate kinase family protein [Glycomyces sp. MUSA5-2]|uniref:carbohydrate kinase family protein n=1 Tax=Glycomyces sp. MUSA5-2 TaxID=2053002 RepID=UPI00300ACD20
MLTVVGEALMDLVRPPGPAAPPAEHPGGSPANVALGTARLGLPTTLLTQLGPDPRGEAIRRHLASAGVAVRTVSDAPTSTATAVLDERGAARYEFDIDWAPTRPLTLPPGSTCLHTGSLATALEPGAAAVEALLAATDAVISYDPNVRPTLMGPPDEARQRIERLVALADVVKASDEDLAWLYPGASPAEVVKSWRGLGPAMVVATLGAGGAYAVTASAEHHCPARPITVADTVGAGDAFTSGMLWRLETLGLLADREALRRMGSAHLATVLDTAVTASAITCTRSGAEPPTREELESFTA